MIDKLRSMAVFVAVVEEGSFRRAGERLGLSPSVVSHHVTNLETRLDVRLLERGSRTLTLTEQGRALYQPARRMVSAAEDGLRSLENTSALLRGQLRIALPHFLNAGRVYLVLEEFLRAHPRVTLDLHLSHAPCHPVNDAFHVVVDAENLADAHVASAPVPTAPSSFFAAPDLAQKIAATATSDIAHQIPLILTAGFSATDWRTVLALPPTQALQFRLHCDDIILAHQLCRLGIGMAVLPHTIVGEDLQTGQLQQVLPGIRLPQMQLYVNWPRSDEKEPLTQAFLVHLTQYLDTQRG